MKSLTAEEQPGEVMFRPFENNPEWRVIADLPDEVAWAWLMRAVPDAVVAGMKVNACYAQGAFPDKSAIVVNNHMGLSVTAILSYDGKFMLLYKSV